MLATNFDTAKAAKISKILDSVLSNKYADFYRKKFGCTNLKISSYSEFSTLPLLFKNEIVSTPFNNRLFIKESEIFYYSCSSGTTGKPTIVPHSYDDFEIFRKYFFNEDFFIENNITKLMTLTSPLFAPTRKFLAIPQTHTKIIQGDMRNLPLMAAMIKEIGIEAFLSTPTVLNFLIDELEKISFNFESIRWVSVSGEFCSALQYAHLKEKFPNAFIRIGYGSSEIGITRHYQCEHLKQSENPNQFHIIPNSEIIEIVNDENKCVECGIQGNILHSDLVEGKAFPMFRYFTGDIGTLSDKECPCGEKYTLRLDGRAQHDVLKFSGVTLRSEMIFKALESVTDIVEKRFQMHVFEEKTRQGKIKPRLELHLKIKPDHAMKKETQYLNDLIIQKVSSSLQLTATSTLKDLAERAIFLPLTIRFVSSWQLDDKKVRNIVSHF